jgi:hypothetical protein
MDCGRTCSMAANSVVVEGPPRSRRPRTVPSESVTPTIETSTRSRRWSFATRACKSSAARATSSRPCVMDGRSTHRKRDSSEFVPSDDVDDVVRNTYAARTEQHRWQLRSLVETHVPSRPENSPSVRGSLRRSLFGACLQRRAESRYGRLVGRILSCVRQLAVGCFTVGCDAR